MTARVHRAGVPSVNQQWLHIQSHAVIKAVCIKCHVMLPLLRYPLARTQHTLAEGLHPPAVAPSSRGAGPGPGPAAPSSSSAAAGAPPGAPSGGVPAGALGPGPPSSSQPGVGPPAWGAARAWARRAPSGAAAAAADGGHRPDPWGPWVGHPAAWGQAGAICPRGGPRGHSGRPGEARGAAPCRGRRGLRPGGPAASRRATQTGGHWWAEDRAGSQAPAEAAS